jgi:disulfide oxidoreductase YuzD
MSWTKRTTHCVAAVAMSCLAIFGGRAEACMVCIPFPQNTVADDLLSATVIVLARENPKKPFSYVAVEVLKGDLDAPQIELFLDSTTRPLGVQS